MHGVVVSVSERGNREEVDKVEGSCPLKDGSDTAGVMNNQRDKEGKGREDQPSHVVVHGLYRGLGLGIELVLHVVERNG